VAQWKDIFGQDAAVGVLQAALKGDRLPHGLIFAGAHGVGKATAAAVLAQVFLCENPAGVNPCQKCPSCNAMRAGTHPDYHVITKELARVHDKSGTSKATQIAINVVRNELSAPAGRKTVLGRGKVFIIEEAELMNTAAQNSLLKTLEEPLGRTIIVLLTDQSGDLLQTVRSRCQTINFARLQKDLIVAQLGKRGIPPADAENAAELCDGSLGTAIRWIEDAVLPPAKELLGAIDSMIDLSGKPQPDESFADLLRRSAETQVEKALARDELTSKDLAMRNGLKLYLGIAARRWRKYLADSSDPRVLERACRAIDAGVLAEKYLDANVTTSLVLEQLGLALR
jgi:DNA polymerase-3 subunit delta'